MSKACFQWLLNQIRELHTISMEAASEDDFDTMWKVVWAQCEITRLIKSVVLPVPQEGQK